MTLLVLGGTADARRVATTLHQQGMTVIYSVAGLVRAPQVPCAVVSGGFTQFGGLQRYMEQQAIRAILDITHPFAQNMSAAAVAAARACSVPCWRFHRNAWQQQPGDRWQQFSDWNELIPALADKRSVFLTAGQLTPEVLAGLVRLPLQHNGTASAPESRGYILRTAAPPKIRLPTTMRWIKAIGPFSEADERALMVAHRVDALVCKNSGGNATVAKLTVARQLGILVLMLRRPAFPSADEEFSDEACCVDAVLQWYRKFKPEPAACSRGPKTGIQ
ncbi:MAG: precorrin-6A/cobalt-precorrin-6A reductase [Motiliproteus sp.]